MSVETGFRPHDGVEEYEVPAVPDEISFVDYSTETMDSVDTEELVRKLNIWWDSWCRQRNIDPKHKTASYVGYCIIELGKNALEHAEGGSVQVARERDELVVVVQDAGNGIQNPNDEMQYAAPNHGLSHVVKFADSFTLESLGTKWEKMPGKRKLRASEGVIVQGTRITFRKKI